MNITPRDRLQLEAEASLAQEEALVDARGFLREALPAVRWGVLDRALELAWIAGRSTGILLRLEEQRALRAELEAEAHGDPGPTPASSP